MEWEKRRKEKKEKRSKEEVSFFMFRSSYFLFHLYPHHPKNS